ncbi:uncharacterized protein LOC120177630 [Hibiscus syriacus]|uniref:uncharacterized protein LOC120177630 n=1 Tax=Hibiscus syriacus TaxID=106335 RepID=UPI0019207883|nr:uncharacterized protein LOC120177630 [Hibiscus syriacus]
MNDTAYHQSLHRCRLATSISDDKPTKGMVGNGDRSTQSWARAIKSNKSVNNPSAGMLNTRNRWCPLRMVWLNSILVERLILALWRLQVVESLKIAKAAGYRVSTGRLGYVRRFMLRFGLYTMV